MAKGNGIVKIDISGIDKGALLAELYNNAKVMGMGVFQASRGPAVMSYEQGRELVGATLRGEFAHDNKLAYPNMFKYDGRSLYFDYLFGRCLKVNLEGDETETWGYDRDWGEGAFAACVQRARADVSPAAAAPVEPTEAEKAEALRKSDESFKILTGDEALRYLGG
jgi:hypothetical protein